MIYNKISPKIHIDNRGSLFEVLSNISEYFFEPKHVYISKSRKDVIRGFHQQLIHPQKKIIFCLAGKIIDHGLNIDPSSNEFGKIKTYPLDGKIGEGVFIDNTTAHGFECISRESMLLYICDKDYYANDQLSINPLDSNFITIWKTNSAIISEKDNKGLSLLQAKDILLKNSTENKYGL